MGAPHAVLAAFGFYTIHFYFTVRFSDVPRILTMAGLWIWVGDNLPSLSEDVHTTTTTTTTTMTTTTTTNGKS